MKFPIKNLYFLSTCIFSLTSCNENPVTNSNEAKTLLGLEKQAIEREFQNDTAFLSSLMDTTFIELSNDKIKNKNVNAFHNYFTLRLLNKKNYN